MKTEMVIKYKDPDTNEEKELVVVAVPGTVTVEEESCCPDDCEGCL